MKNFPDSLDTAILFWLPCVLWGACIGLVVGIATR
jgi:hypothetical protein